MAKTAKIKLTDLQINTENYRFEPVASQKEAIDKMIHDQGDRLYYLAQHIIENDLNPNDKIQVVVSNHDSTKYNVVEGNRRTVALKLLNSPDTIDSTDGIGLRKKFRKLHDENKSKIIKQIECTVYDNPSEADKWIKIKHAGQVNGAGTVPWTSQQVQRFEEKVEGKSSLALQTIKILEDSPDVPQNIKDSLVDLKVTNLERLLSDPDVRDLLGVEINNGIIQSETEQKEVIKGLTQVAKDLLNPSFNVKKIYTKDDRRDYLKNFPKSSKPNLKKKSAKPWQFNKAATVSTSKNNKKNKSNPKERKKLIPKSCIIPISNPRVNAIYHELQAIDVIKFANAVAVLYRVFIELSIDSYIEEHSLVGTPSAAKSGMDFQQKINVVANHLDSKKMADAAITKGIKAAIKDKNDILGIDTWHAYVHNNRFSPKAQNLIITWDNIQQFIIIVWNNIK